MSRNVTLTIDENLLRAARKIALDRDTSVNALIREYLESLVAANDEQRDAMREVELLFEAKPYAIGIKDWSRDDLYQR